MKNEGVPRVAAHFYSGVPPHRIFSERLPKPLCDTGELAFRLVLQAEKTEGLYPRPMIAFTLNLMLHFLRCGKSVVCGGAASAPSEEGAVAVERD